MLKVTQLVLGNRVELPYRQAVWSQSPCPHHGLSVFALRDSHYARLHNTPDSWDMLKGGYTSQHHSKRYL